MRGSTAVHPNHAHHQNDPAEFSHGLLRGDERKCTVQIPATSCPRSKSIPQALGMGGKEAPTPAINLNSEPRLAPEERLRDDMEGWPDAIEARSGHSPKMQMPLTRLGAALRRKYYNQHQG
jgi:hypothetical protein